MGKRSRQRSAAPKPEVPSTVYEHPEAGALELRGVLTLKARAEYSRTLHGGLEREDAWQRATELLFERLAVTWTIAGLRIDRQRELLGRYRLASGDERGFVRAALREHVREHFPELEAP